jgi:hypothetical protein
VIEEVPDVQQQEIAAISDHGDETLIGAGSFAGCAFILDLSVFRCHARLRRKPAKLGLLWKVRFP